MYALTLSAGWGWQGFRPGILNPTSPARLIGLTFTPLSIVIYRDSTGVRRERFTLVVCVVNSNYYSRNNVSTIERFFRCVLLPPLT
jgi:hypothetical protein